MQKVGAAPLPRCPGWGGGEEAPGGGLFSARPYRGAVSPWGGCGPGEEGLQPSPSTPACKPL